MNVRATVSLVLFFAAGAAFAHHTPKHERAEALATIKRLGGTITRTDKAVTKIDLHNTAVTDADLEMLLSIAELRELDVRETGITDAGIMPLHDLKQLRMLRVKQSRVSAAGVARLQKKLPQLEIER